MDVMSIVSSMMAMQAANTQQQIATSVMKQNINSEKSVLQLLQPAFGLILAGLLLREPVAWTMIAAAGLVVLCVAGAKRFA